MQYKVDWPARGHEYCEEDFLSLLDVLKKSSSNLTQGDQVKLFEKEFAEYIGSPYAFALMSCAHALDISAMLLDIKPGDEVIIPSHTYCATAIAFARRGATIKWADIDKKSFTMCHQSVENLISERTKAVVLVHIYGLLSPNINKILQITRQRKICLIEDCAQSLGAKIMSRHCGTFGDIGCFSFHAQKNLTTLGEGGMIITKNSNYAELISSLRLNGHKPYKSSTKYWLPAMTNIDLDMIGVWPIKSTMNEAQAAVGRSVLKRLDFLTEKRRERGLLIRAKLEDIAEITFQDIHDSDAHSHHLLPIKYIQKGKNRNDLIQILSHKYKIKAIVQYHPLHRYDLFIKSGHGRANVPVTEDFFDNMLSIPFSLCISDDDFNYIINSLREAVFNLRTEN